MYYVYILMCWDSTLYTGTTNDLERRVWAHNESKVAARYTRGRRPVRLVYAKKYKTKGKALSREHEIKNLTRKEKLNLIKDNL